MHMTPMQQKLDFLIIGAQKSGTTSLYDYLAGHPGIFLPKTKEIAYFAADEFYRQGDAYLHSFYKDAASTQLLGGAYVHLMYFDHVPHRIFQYNKNIKCIALLRNPIDRAYSAYWFARRNQWETACSFEEALALEEERRSFAGKGVYRELTYLHHGHYFEQLAPFREVFGPEAMHIILTDNFKREPQSVLEETFDFLRLGPMPNSPHRTIMSNAAKIPRSARLQRVFTRRDAWHRRLARRWVPRDARRLLRDKITRKLMDLNMRNFTYPPMRNETRCRLREYFYDHNEKLGRMIGRDLSHWQ